MKKEDKLAFVQEMKDKLAESESFFLIDYRGLTVVEMQELRGLLRKIEGRIKIIKNTLTARAFKDSGIDGFDEALEGPAAIVWSDPDPAASAKALKDFSKEHENLEFKAGFLGGQILDVAQVEALAKLPSKPVLLAELVGAIEGPISGLVFTLEGVLRDFVMTLQSIADEKEKAA